MAGTVVVTYRHAVKDVNNNIPFGETMPVHYGDLTGLTIEETESLQDYEAFPVIGTGEFEGISREKAEFSEI